MQVKLVVGDMSDRALLDRIFTTHDITAVMHFAAYIAVGESVTYPAKYYRNNVNLIRNTSFKGGSLKNLFVNLTTVVPPFLLPEGIG